MKNQASAPAEIAILAPSPNDESIQCPMDEVGRAPRRVHTVGAAVLSAVATVVVALAFVLQSDESKPPDPVASDTSPADAPLPTTSPLPTDPNGARLLSCYGLEGPRPRVPALYGLLEAALPVPTIYGPEGFTSTPSDLPEPPSNQ